LSARWTRGNRRRQHNVTRETSARCDGDRGGVSTDSARYDRDRRTADRESRGRALRQPYRGLGGAGVVNRVAGISRRDKVSSISCHGNAVGSGGCSLSDLRQKHHD